MSRTLVSVVSAVIVTSSILVAPVASAGHLVSIDVPSGASIAQAAAVTVHLPSRVAAIDGRVLLDDAVGELVGIAPVGSGATLSPLKVADGYAFGAYGLESRQGRTSIQLVIAPRVAGRIDLRIMVDAAADASGSRLTLDDSDLVVTLRVARGTRSIEAPRGTRRQSPPRTARPTRDVSGRGVIAREDLDIIRAAWYASRESANSCTAQLTAEADANSDGCVDIVDAQALLAAQGRRNTGGGDLFLTASDPAVMQLALEVTASKTFVVNSTADTPDQTPGDGTCANSQGGCTLRAAITESNWNSGIDRIDFNLAGAAPVQIQLGSTLPVVGSSSGGAIIDGYSQPGSRVNTASFGSNAVPGVEIRGTGTNMSYGLYVPRAGTTIRGLLINEVGRGIFVDGAAASNTRILGNFIGFRADNSLPPRGKAGVSLNNGARLNFVGSPDLADRNVIGNFDKAIYSYGAGTDGNTTQNNVLCIRPSGLTAPCQIGMDHDFGPKNSLVGGTGPNERNVIGPTTLNGIELSHGWDPSTKASTLTWQVNGHRVIGNWIGFRQDGSYSAAYRSAQNVPTYDNGQGVNIYDGANDNLLEGNHIAAVYDGVSSTMSNASRNIIRDNVIGESPLGEPAPLARWGVYFRINTRDHVVEGNVIRNAGLGGIGLLEHNVRNIRISQNIVTNSNGPAIYLTPDPDNPSTGANALVPPPTFISASATVAAGTGIPGARVEVFHASRPAGQEGLPMAYLGSGVVAQNGTWNVTLSGSIGTSDRVTALQIRTDDNTSELGANVLTDGPVGLPVAPTGDFDWEQQAGGLAVSFTDTSTGSPTSWSWDFGDGVSSTQQHPTRTYASDGTYTVVLTVTNQGGSDDATRQITVVAPADGTLAADGFTRTSTNGWGSAETGGAYALEGTSANFSVSGGEGKMVLPVKNANRATLLSGVSADDVDVRFRVRADVMPQGGPHYVYAVVRRTGNNAYRPKLIINPNGTVAVHAGVVVNNSESSVAPSVVVPGLTYTTDSFVWLRAEVTGSSPTTIRVKAWADGQPEPSSWQFVATNSTTAVQSAGAVGLRAYTSSNAAPVTFSFDDFSVLSLP